MSKNTQQTNESIALISNRGDVVQKTASPHYFHEVTEGNFTYSVDMIRLKFKLTSPKTVENVMNLIRDISIYSQDTSYDYEYTQRTGWNKYRHNFSIKLKDGNSFYIAFCFNSNDKTKVSEGVIEFNPNKCFGHQTSIMKQIAIDRQETIVLYEGELLTYFLINLISHNAKYVRVKRFDIAIDVPYCRSQVHLLKDNRIYKMVSPSQDLNQQTEYLGRHQNSGFVKVYNKTVESNLDRDMTRIEITSEYFDDYKSFMSQFPSVYVKGNGSLNPYIELKGTDLVLYQLLIQNDNMDRYFKQLGRDKQKKLHPYLYQDTDDIQVSVSQEIYEKLMKIIKGMSGLKDIVHT